MKCLNFLFNNMLLTVS